MSQLCEGCHEPLLGPGRSIRRFHGGPCRKKAWQRRRLEQQAPELTPPEPTHAEPSHALDREAVLAEAVSEPVLLLLVARAARSNWRAASWLLERRFPERWSARSRDELVPLAGDDPFAEVDQLAARRRLHHTYD
jgi:hypothetical protein